MCGIVGYVGQQAAEPIIVDGLAKLEYRGYDSAGIAVVDKTAHQVLVRRSLGKLVNLRKKLQEMPVLGADGSVCTHGIGHTRWATHGRPSEENAHPHTSDGITVVHNGIIENHAALREMLKQKGRIFSSQTDTEIVAHLLALARAEGADLLTALEKTLAQIEGAYSVAIIDEHTPDTIAFAKQATPLVIGLGQHENFLASDVPAVLAHTRQFIFLEDGDYGVVTPNNMVIRNLEQPVGQDMPRDVVRPSKTVQWSPVMAEKDGHKHFMHKEIWEQPRAVTDTLRERLISDDNTIALDGIDVKMLAKANRIIITACGTSYYAGLIGKYLLEKLARIPTDVELASELRYRDAVFDDKTLVIAISQSGETADTLAALKEAMRAGAMAMSVCNAVGSAIPRLVEKSGGTLYTRAGLEIGVASTKAFVTQLVAMHLLAIAIGQGRGTLDAAARYEEWQALAKLSREIEKVALAEQRVRTVAHSLMHAKHMLFLGRGLCYPIALEGALKLKEISYIHAEGYAAGEMKHGPIALIDEDMPVLVLAPDGVGYDKVVSNAEEVRARGGRLIAVVTEGETHLSSIAEHTIFIPPCHPHAVPTLAVVPLQLLAYHIADLRGTDVDQPRNLAKSVTVE